MVEWARPLTIIGWFAGTLVIPGFGIALLIRGRRERRLGRESGAGYAFRAGLTALAAVWIAALAPAVLFLCGVELTSNVSNALIALLVDVSLIYLFRWRSGRRRLIAEERLRAQQEVEEANREGV